MPLPGEQIYTIEDIYDLPDGQRAELIDGQIYDMALPTRKHQNLLYIPSATLCLSIFIPVSPSISAQSVYNIMLSTKGYL